MRASLIAIVIALIAAATARADDTPVTAPDPTQAPIHTPAPVTTPAATLPPAAATSAKLSLLSPRRIVLDRRHLRTRLEVRCNAAATGGCDATGTLTMSAHGHRTRLGGWRGHILGQQIFAPTFALTTAVRTLRSGHPLHALLRLTNRTTHQVRVTTVPSGISTVVTLPVTLVILPPDPPPLPTVTTGVATDIVAPGVHGSDGSANVAGLVNPKGNSGVTYRFEYGQAAGNYIRLAGPDGTIDSADNVDHLVTATMTPIAAPVIHYRLIAFGPTGTTFGADQHFPVPFVFPSTLPAPQTDTTAAGLVIPSVLDNHCVTTAVPAMVTGATLTCSVVLFNPQPPVLFGGPTPIAVRPASIVVAVDAPQGAVGASSQAPVEPVPVTIAPSTTATISANFIVGHPFGVALGERVETGTGAPSAAQMPSFAHAALTAKLSCTSPKDFVAFCTAEVRNIGTDSADISSFSMSGEHMTPIATLAGDPPQVLAGAFAGADAGAAVSVKQTFRADARPPVTTTPTMTVTISGFDDTDRHPVSATASDVPTLVARRR